MKIFTLAALATTALALSGHGVHHNRARGLKAGGHHRQIARDVNYNDRLHFERAQRSKRATRFDRRDARATKRSNLSRRKVLGTGDSATFPDNAAKGTFTAEQGCTCWHTVAPGEVCLGLIDKSSPGFTLDKFYKFNPSVGSGCSGLDVGSAYCVDDEKSTSSGKATAKTTKSVNVQLAATKTKSATKPTATDALDAPVDDTDDEDCDDDEDDTSATASDDDDEEDCDEEDDGDDSGDSSTSSSNSNSNNANSNSNNGNSNASSNSNAAPAKISVGVSIGLGNKPSSTSTSQQSQPTGGSGGNPSQYSGIATYYYQKGNAGACGDYNPDSAYIVALYTNVYSGGAHCGKQVKLTNTDTGVSVTATVADMCPSCGGDGDIDTSEAVFNVLSGNNLGAGVENVKWGFL